MTADRNKLKWWQISLRALLVMMAALPAIAGLFYGTFGERARENAVWLLQNVARALLPTACGAMAILLTLGLWSLAKRLRNG